MATVLVTGGAGYIGSHAVQALGRAGRDVVVYDNLSAGHRAATLGAPLEIGDTADEARLREVIRRYRVTAVMHFAARLDVGESVRDPALYYRNNVSGTVSLLGAMVAEGVRHLIFSSTCAVYGEPERTPIDERHPARPINAYGETKLAIERALPHFERACGLRAICLRYFNAAGADPGGRIGERHDPESHLIPLTLKAAKGKRRNITIFGEDYPTPDGTCIRDYVHVTDLADAHLLALEHLLRKGSTQAFNCGYGHGYSVREVIDTARRVTAIDIPVEIAARRQGDPPVLVADSTKLRQTLGWIPRHDDLEYVIRTAWEWEKKQR